MPSLLGLAVTLPVPAAEVTYHGLLSLRPVATRSQPSWLDGGFGRLVTDGDASGGSQVDLYADLEGAVEWHPTPSLGFFVHGVARAEPSGHGDQVGLVEAYGEFTTPALRRGEVRVRLGHFFLPTSRENVEPLWTSPYTVTLSAWNSWIAEEFRLTAADARFRWRSDSYTADFAATVFGGNDSSGALVAWRGFTMGSRRTTWGEVVQLPPLESLGSGFALQRDDGTRPFGRDLDDRLGWALRGRLVGAGGKLAQLTFVDNRGDRALYRGEYAWRTRFRHFAFELPLGASLILVAEAADGSTGMGFRQRGVFVDADFRAVYLLASLRLSEFRVSLRYDAFDVEDVDLSAAEDNNEDGEAWTAAFFWEPRKRLRLGLELLRLDAQRAAALESGFDPNTDGRSALVELRLSL